MRISICFPPLSLVVGAEVVVILPVECLLSFGLVDGVSEVLADILDR